MDDQPSGETPADGQFEKARYKYCLSLYERETARKDTLERKGQLYLSLLALFVGAVFLKIDVLSGLRDLLNSPTTGCTERAILLGSALLFAVALLGSLIAVLLAIQVRGYAIEYPSRFVRSLFSLPSDFLPQPDEPLLHREAALALATAFEEDRKLNDKKARCVEASSFLLFTMLLALSAFMAALAHVSLR